MSYPRQARGANGTGSLHHQERRRLTDTVCAKARVFAQALLLFQLLLHTGERDRRETPQLSADPQQQHRIEKSGSGAKDVYHALPHGTLDQLPPRARGEG